MSEPTDIQSLAFSAGDTDVDWASSDEESYASSKSSQSRGTSLVSDSETEMENDRNGEKCDERETRPITCDTDHGSTPFDCQDVGSTTAPVVVTPQSCYSSTISQEEGGPPASSPHLMDGYFYRRNQRLHHLKAGRDQRQQQLELESATVLPLLQQHRPFMTTGESRRSALSTMAADAAIIMEDHPYYLAQQAEKIAAVVQPTTRSESSVEGSMSSSSHLSLQDTDDLVDQSLGNELVAAYQLIRKQRIRIQQLEKERDGVSLWNGGDSGPTTTCRGELPATPNNQIAAVMRKLQSQLIHMQHSRAHGEFQLRHRITEDAVKYRERLMYHKTKSEYWQVRTRNAEDRHVAQLQQTQDRIRALEEEAVSTSRGSTSAAAFSCSNELLDGTSPGGGSNHSRVTVSTFSSSVSSLDLGTVRTLVPDVHSPPAPTASAGSPRRQRLAYWKQPAKNEPLQKKEGCALPQYSPLQKEGSTLGASQAALLQQVISKQSLCADSNINKREVSSFTAASYSSGSKFSLFNRRTPKN